MGKLIYLTYIKPDLAYAVSVVSQFIHNPSDQHMNAVNEILAYLKSAPGEGVCSSNMEISMLWDESTLILLVVDWIEDILPDSCRLLEVR